MGLYYEAIDLFFIGFCVMTFGYAESLDMVVAEINEAIITKSELEQNVEETKVQLEARHVNAPVRDVLRKQVFQHLVDVNLQLQFAKNNNIVLENDELEEIIKNIALQNKLPIEQMKTEVEKTGLSWQRYKDNLKRNYYHSFATTSCWA